MVKGRAVHKVSCFIVSVSYAIRRKAAEVLPDSLDGN